MNKPSGIRLRADVANDQREPRIVPSLERRRLRAYIALMAVDALVFHFAFGLASLLYSQVAFAPRAMLAAQILLPVYFTIALYNSTYGARSLLDWGFAGQRALTALIIAAALFNFIAFYAKANEEFSRATLTIGIVLCGICLVTIRRIVPVVIQRYWRGRIQNKLLITDGGPSFELDDSVEVSAAHYNLDPTSCDPFMLDRLGKLMRNQDKVVVSCPRERREQWAFLMKSTGVYGEIVSEPAHALGAIGVHRYEEQGRTTLVVSTGPLGLRSRIAKRLFDIGVATAGLIVLSPLLVAIAVLVKLDDGGPVLFVQRRLGRGNQFFNMYKFRSMREEKLDQNGERSTQRDDDRITPIGHFIRRTSIDELPQLFNVLLGDMSIVGPRPHALGSRANNKLFWEVDAAYWQRHCLKPGLTGLAQVRGHRGATEREKDLTDRLQSDLEYISNWSLRHDIMIVLKTVLVLRHKNAY